MRSVLFVWRDGAAENKSRRCLPASAVRSHQGSVSFTSTAPLLNVENADLASYVAEDPLIPGPAVQLPDLSAAVALSIECQSGALLAECAARFAEVLDGVIGAGSRRRFIRAERLCLG